MKQLVDNLQKLLVEKGKTLDLNGMELMDVLNIKATDLYELCEQYEFELYDIMYVETSTNYAREFKKVFEFPNEVCWYEKDALDPKYITDGMSRVYESCDMFMGDIFKQGIFMHYSTSLKEVISLLKEISQEDEIRFRVQYCFNEYIELIIKDKQVSEIKFTDIDIERLTDEDKKILLYQLIVLSYDVSLKETLKLLALI
ncbi:MAG: hypothetical protein E7183_08100 [Erysipelotrichaceae bacterium]|nr:hypothetical protein [Erysipelotrichaceae bacterium]